METSTHICIIWGCQLHNRDRIVKTLKSLGVKLLTSTIYAIELDADRKAFLKAFYHSSETSYSEKSKRVNASRFLSLEIQITSQLGYHESSRDINIVDLEAIKLKKILRKGCTPYDGIHISDSNEEALLQKKILQKCFKSSDQETNVFTGYGCIDDLKEVINEGSNYVILRKPEEFTNDSSAFDIDILTSSRKSFVRLGMMSRKSKNLSRCLFEVKVGGKTVTFDIREPIDNYYPAEWAFLMLANREYHKKFNAYILSPTDQYYALAYHSFIHKRSGYLKYQSRLDSILFSLIGVQLDVDSERKSEEHKKRLFRMLKAKNYEPVPCNDSTVCFILDENKSLYASTPDQENEIVCNSRQSVLQNAEIAGLLKKALLSPDNNNLVAKKNGKLHASWLFRYNQYLIKITKAKHVSNTYMLTEEARILEHLNGIFSPQIYWWGPANIPSSDSVIIMIQEFINGITLSDLLTRSDISLSSKQAAYINKQLMQAKSHLESMNVMHHDLSPDNIIIQSNCIIKIIDFGLASFSFTSIYNDVYDHAEQKVYSIPGVGSFDMRNDNESFDYLSRLITNRVN